MREIDYGEEKPGKESRKGEREESRNDMGRLSSREMEEIHALFSKRGLSEELEGILAPLMLERETLVCAFTLEYGELYARDLSILLRHLEGVFRSVALDLVAEQYGPESSICRSISRYEPVLVISHVSTSNSITVRSRKLRLPGVSKEVKAALIMAAATALVAWATRRQVPPDVNIIIYPSRPSVVLDQDVDCENKSAKSADLFFKKTVEATTRGALRIGEFTIAWEHTKIETVEGRE